jgi:phage baseplate assembly protein W
MADVPEFVGRGWSFPPDFDPVRAGVTMVEAETDIEQSLRLIVETRIGERVMQPTFGCGLVDEVFESYGVGTATDLDGGRIAMLQNHIKLAILHHEPRIDAEDPVIEMDPEGQLLIRVEYVIRGTNSRFNFVHPYYLRED